MPSSSSAPGDNGLATAFYLAKAGLKPSCLKRRTVGGGAVTRRFRPGFRCPTLSHAIGPLRPSVVRDMRLAARDVELIAPDPRLVSLSPDGGALTFSADVARTAEAIRVFSEADATKYPEFCSVLERLGAFLGEILETTPPSLDGPAAGELWELLKRPPVSRARTHRLVPAPPMDADGRRRFWSPSGSRTISCRPLSRPAEFSASPRDRGLQARGRRCS